MKVLIVDDDPIVSIVLATILQKHGFTEILTAENGDKAERLLLAEGEHDIGLMFLDLNMPKRNGIEFISFLSGRPSAPSIVFVTGAHQTIVKGAEALASANQLHVIGTLRKPIEHLQASEIIRLAQSSRDATSQKAAC